jgi:hypothetical protein
LLSVSAIEVLYGHSNSVKNILELSPNQECPVTVDGLTSTSFPWTHQPTCLEVELSGSSSQETFCVYTSSRFANGRGISFITTPEVATAYLLESFSNEDQEDRGRLPYEARESGDRGIGLFATRKLRAGEALTAKHPVLLVARELLYNVTREQRQRLLEISIKQLPQKTTDLVMGLAKSRGGNVYDDIVQTNAKGMRLGQASHLGVVPETARVNHACRPNTYYRFDDYTLTLDFFPLRDIEAGEELSYTYGFSELQYRDRQQKLNDEWGFKCSCSLCSASKEERAKSDDHLEDIAGIKERLPDTFDGVPQLIALLPQLISLMEAENLTIELPMYEEILAYAWSSMGIEDRAKHWAKRARKGWEIVAGKESWEAKRMRTLEDDVKGHGTWMTWDKDPFDNSVWEDDHDHDHEEGEEHDH